jgi:hypothetical protein
MHANIPAVLAFLPEDRRVFMANNEGIKIDLQERPSADILRTVEKVKFFKTCGVL